MVSWHDPVVTGALQVSPLPLTVTVTVPVGVPAPDPLGTTVHPTVTGAPTPDGSGESLVMVVVVPDLFTVCGSLSELALKFPSPGYDAVMVFAPGLVNVMSHWPALTGALQLSDPALTVTLPLGVPLPGAATMTEKTTVTGWPTTDGSGVSGVMMVVVFAAFTV
jgi:hypothetical protein